MKRYVVSVMVLSLFSHTLLAQDVAAFKAKRDKEVKARAAAVSRVMNDCKIHTAGSDVENRKIANEVLIGMGDTCKVQKPTQGMEAFMKDVKKAVRGTDQNKIWDETTLIALEKSVQGLLALHMRVVNKTGQTTYAQAQAIICSQAPGFCKPGRPELPVIKKSIENFLAAQKKSPIKYMDGQMQEKMKNEFNTYVDYANKTCALTKKKYFEIKMAHNCMPPLNFKMVPGKNKGDKPTFVSLGKPKPAMTQGQCDEELRKAYNKHRELESIATESVNLNMQLLITSELGPLFATKSFRKKVGTLSPDFIFKSCMKGEGKVLNPVWHADINEARSELYGLALKELKTIESKRLVPPQYVDKERELEKYLKTNPLTISELLKRSNDPVYAKSICYYIKDIHRSDKISNYIDAGLMTVGVISSLAFGFATGGAGFAVLGPAATTLAAISIGSTALVISKNAVDYHNLLQDDQSTRQAISTKQRDLDQGIKALEASDMKKDALISNMKWSAAGMVLEVAGIGFAMKKAATYIADLKKAPVLFEMVEGTTTSAKATSLHKGSQTFTKAVKALDPDKVGLLKNLTADQQTKFAAIFSKLDDVAAKAMVEKLSKLDQAGFNKFFKMLDDVTTANLTQKSLIAALDDFSKSGKPKRLLPKLTPEELAKVGPSVPKDASKVAAAFPESTRSLKDILPAASPAETQKLLKTVRGQYRGMVNDKEIGLMIERFGLEGAKTSSDIVKKFERLTEIKQRNIDLFAPKGIMNSAALKDEGELTKLAYLDELEKNGVPMRNAAGELIMSADGNSVLRLKMSKMTPAQRYDAIMKELNTVAKQNPCSL